MQAQDLLALDTLSLQQLPGQQHLVINHYTNQRTILRADLLPFLRLCESFRTLQEHQQAITASLNDPRLSSAAVTDWLNHLRHTGMLLNAQQWLERTQNSRRVAEQDSDLDWVLAIITCDRPMLLQRLLNSTITHIKTLNRHPVKVLLLDDSRQKDHQVVNRSHWANWLNQCELQGEYWDREARSDLCKRLQQSGMAKEAQTIDWLLSPNAHATETSTPGQTRNLALLLSAGRRLLLLDDDCVLDPRAHAQRCQSPHIGSLPVQLMGFGDQAALNQAMKPIDVNPFDSHLRHLGKHPQDVLGQLEQNWQDPTWLRTLDPIARKRLNGNTRVSVTVNGTCGDPGTEHMDWLYTRPSDCLTQLGQYLQQFSKRDQIERCFWRGYNQPVLTYDENLMTTTLTGLDNRLLLPCMLPAGRNEDLVLGNGITTLHPDALFLIDSWSLPHHPEPVRYWQRPTLGATSPMPGLGYVIARSMHNSPLNTTIHEPLTRIECLAHYYHSLATLATPQLTAELEQDYLRVKTVELAVYRINQASNQTTGSHWQRDLAVLIEQANQAIAQPRHLDTPWLKTFRETAEQYAKALLLWPRLRECTIESHMIP